MTSTNPSGNVTRKLFVAQATLGTGETWLYDDDGNLTRDDQWSYTWDAENRLVSMATRTDLLQQGIIAAADARQIEFRYDYLGRRASKKVWSGWNGSLFATMLSETRFMYHGWNLVGEFLVGSSSTLSRSFTWGLDLSGSLAGDGGTGGLLMMSEAGTKYVYAYDGNGNVSAVMNQASGTTVAEYEYGPFGDSLRASNTSALTNPFRFSTQYADNETGLLYYGYRYYSPSTGRFLGRDPAEEGGGLHAYAFCRNNPLNTWDVLGREPEYEYGYGGVLLEVAHPDEVLAAYGGEAVDMGHWTEGDTMRFNRMVSEAGNRTAYEMSLGYDSHDTYQYPVCSFAFGDEWQGLQQIDLQIDAADAQRAAAAAYVDSFVARLSASTSDIMATVTTGFNAVYNGGLALTLATDANTLACSVSAPAIATAITVNVATKVVDSGSIPSEPPVSGNGTSTAQTVS
ncbi:MAG TPA: RHS repeat-associated core domain-containing protein, partial [Opitutaceae bacterium]|nr:RHS repeat-associated core domain-containing protein [Opitutaceae bacterium]